MADLLGNKEDKKLDWMYRDATQIVDREEYLLGRKIDKQFETSVLPPARDQECLPPSIFSSGPRESQVDITRKLQEDPLYLIKKKEIECREQLLKNPRKMKQLQEMIARQQAAAEKLKKKQIKKRNKEELDSLLVKKCKKLFGGDGTKKLAELDESGSETSSSADSKVGVSKKKKKKKDRKNLDRLIAVKYKKVLGNLDAKALAEMSCSSDSSSENHREKKLKRKKERSPGSSGYERERYLEDRMKKHKKGAARGRRKSSSSEEENKPGSKSKDSKRSHYSDRKGIPDKDKRKVSTKSMGRSRSDGQSKQRQRSSSSSSDSSDSTNYRKHSSTARVNTDRREGKSKQRQRSSSSSDSSDSTNYRKHSSTARVNTDRREQRVEERRYSNYSNIKEEKYKINKEEREHFSGGKYSKIGEKRRGSCEKEKNKSTHKSLMDSKNSQQKTSRRNVKREDSLCSESSSSVNASKLKKSHSERNEIKNEKESESHSRNHKDKSPHETEGSSSSSSEDSPSERRNETKKQYGLVLPANYVKKNITKDEVKIATNKEEETSKTYRKEDKRKLTDEEKKRKLKEMMENAKWRDEQRDKNIKAFKEKEKSEKDDYVYNEDFMRKQMAIAVSQGTVESRVKANINTIQRSGASMSEHFARRK